MDSRNYSLEVTDEDLQIFLLLSIYLVLKCLPSEVNLIHWFLFRPDSSHCFHAIECHSPAVD